MYLPKQFEVQDLTVLHQLIHDYPLATLVNYQAENLNANHIPLMLLPESEASSWGGFTRTCCPGKSIVARNSGES
ncbi:MAG: hypothetical protein RIS84_1795 [Pseudomonadota bacterium]|jgi:transcriptional regulator